MATNNTTGSFRENLEGAVQSITVKKNVNGKEFVTVSLLRDGMTYPTNARSTDPNILERMGNARKHLDNNVSVRLGLEVTATPRSEGGYFRDIVTITSSTIGDVAQEPDDSDNDTPVVNQRQSPTQSPSGSLDERIAWNSAINNAVTAIPWISNYYNAETDDNEGFYTPNWLSEVDTLAQDIYALIRRGPVAPVEEAVDEADAPDGDQPDEDQPDEDSSEESEGAEFEA